MQDTATNFKMEYNINWDDLKKKVDQDIQNDVDEEVSAVKDIEEKEGKFPGIIRIRSKFNMGLPNKAIIFGEDSEEDSEEDQDYEDEGGELPELTEEQISKIAWNNNDEGESRNPFWKPRITYKREELIPTPIPEEEEEFQDALDLFETTKAEYENESEEENGKYSMECLHIDDSNESDIYVYPIDEDQELCLCPDCNSKLAGQMLEQLALEFFTK